MPRLPIFILLVALAACGGRDDRPVPVVSVETYLDSPKPGQASQAAAGRRCLLIGGRAVFRETRTEPGGTAVHIYECRRLGPR